MRRPESSGGHGFEIADAPVLRIAQRIPQHRISLRYRLSLLLAVFVMLLMPTIYVALVAGLGYGVVMHAVHNIPARPRIIWILLYLVVLVGGSIAVVCLLGALIPARRRDDAFRIELTPAEQPLLFTWIGRIAEAIDAPMPRSIWLMPQPGASAVMRGGVVGLFREHLVLSLGVTLIRGLDTQQLASVVAHELGHFSQRGGRGATVLVGSLLGWFQRIIDSRSRLEQMKLESDAFGWVTATLWVARASLWSARMLLRGMLRIGSLVWAHVSRQMEFDADAYSAEVSGSACAIAALRRFDELSPSWQAALERAQDGWRHGRVPDDLPALAVALAELLPSDVRERLHRESLAETTRWFSTHPAAKTRYAAITRLNARGVYQHAEPASRLVRDLDRLGKAVTLSLYRAILGDRLQSEQLVPTREFHADAKRSRSAHDAIEMFFGGPVDPSCLVFLHPEIPRGRGTSDRARLHAGLASARRTAREEAPQFRTMTGRAVELGVRVQQLKLALSLHRASMSAAARTAAPDLRGVDALRAGLSEAVIARAGVRQQLETIERASDDRIGRALALLDIAVDAGQPEASELLDRATAALGVLEGLRESHQAIEELRDQLVCMQGLVMAVKGGTPTDAFMGQFTSMGRDLDRQLESIRTLLTGRDDALGLHGGTTRRVKATAADDGLIPLVEAGDGGLAARVVHAPQGSDPLSALGAADSTCAEWIAVYREALGTLVRVVLKVERAEAAGSDSRRGAELDSSAQHAPSRS